MRRRHTRLSDPALSGPTIQRSIRIPSALIDETDELVKAGVPEIYSLTDAVTDALWLWNYEARRIGTPAAKVARSLPVREAPVVDEGMVDDTEGRDEEVDSVPERPFAGAGLRLPSDDDGRRPDFSGVELPSFDG